MEEPFVAWTEKMSVGVALLDDDHKKLLSLLNDLHSGIESGRGTERLGRVLDGLVSYVKNHFAHEEDLFAQTEYPGADDHILEHRSLTKLVLDVQTRYNKGQFDALSLDTMEFLKNWLHDHVLGSDRDYKEHLHASGIR